MIKFENTEVMGWEAAIRGMRNPKNSWEKNDSFCSDKCSECSDRQKCSFYFSERGTGRPYRNRFRGDFHYIGPNDHKLMMNLRSAGTDHRKFMRMIVVYVDITAPLYWWKEFDTYKVGTVANSCSTMHKIADKEFDRGDFSHEHIPLGSDAYSDTWDVKTSDMFFPINVEDEIYWSSEDILDLTIQALNHYRNKYLGAKTKPMKNESKRAELMKKYWWQMIQLLPSSYNQKRTVMMDYEVLANIYVSRKKHPLDEWSVGFMEWIESLLYSELICGPEFYIGIDLSNGDDMKGE